MLLPTLHSLSGRPSRSLQFIKLLFFCVTFTYSIGKKIHLQCCLFYIVTLMSKGALMKSLKLTLSLRKKPRQLVASPMARLVKNLPAMQEMEISFNSWVVKFPWRRKWQPTPVFLPGVSHGQRHLVGYSPWGCKELDTTERLSPHPQDNYFESQVPTFDTSLIRIFTIY